MTKRNPFFGGFLLLFSLILLSCGGGGGGSDNESSGDTTPPSGYSAELIADLIDEDNEEDVSFAVTGAEVGATFEYSLSLGESQLTGSGLVSQADFNIADLDVRAFPAGVVNLEFSLTDAAGNRGPTVDDTAEKTNEPVFVLLSGTVTFDFVPRGPLRPLGLSSLDYENIQVRPVRGATIEIISDSDTLVFSTETNANGEYFVTILPDQNVLVRVRAELLREDTASWDFSVTDNTNENALYTMEGSLAAISANQTRDLHAPADWNFPGYSPGRRAAPFAVLDAVYQIVDTFVEVDPDIQLPPAEFRWSENNTTEDGDISLGQIGGSFYRPFGFGGPDAGNIFIVGAEDDDTDEYDYHVIVHEWGHYFEDRLSRSDSIGGPHSNTTTLDMRVAFGEGWGNGLSAIILDDPIYVDVKGPSQFFGFSFDIENGDLFDAVGWYGEGSVHSIIYDLYDADPDGADAISLGLEPIYEALIAPEYVEQGTLTSIYSFLTQLIEDNPSDAGGIRSLAVEQDIFGTGFDGQGETNDNGVPEVLPIYQVATVNGSAVEVCSDNLFDESNRLGNRRFVLVNLPSPGRYTFRAERVRGLDDANPGITIIGPRTVSGEVGRFTCGSSESGNIETSTCSGLSDGEHVVEVFDAGNVDGEDSTGGFACFNVTITD